jgi:glycosyl transferase family 25
MEKDCLPIFVINLDRSTDRLERITDDFNKVGLEFIRVPAVDGRSLSAKEYMLYDEKESKKLHGRGLSNAEIACSLSHMNIYHHMVDEKIPMALICEDDTVPTTLTLNFINDIDALPDDWEIVKLVYETCSWDDPYCRLTKDIIVKQFNDRVAYTTAYLLSLDGAKKILEYGYPVRFAADGLTGRFRETGVRMYGTHPFCVDRSYMRSTIDGARRHDSRYDGIVLVSNSHMLGGGCLGSEIDKFNHVVRFNNAIMSPEVSRDVGTKTTHWVCSDWSYWEEPRRVFSHADHLMAIPDTPCRKGYVPPQGVSRFPEGHEIEIRKKMLSLVGREDANVWCTTGMISLSWFLTYYPTVHVAGFLRGNTSTNPSEFIHHYGCPKNATGFIPTMHDVQAERALLDLWVKEGRVIELEDIT